jgi:hypothetical protein
LSRLHSGIASVLCCGCAPRISRYSYSFRRRALLYCVEVHGLDVMTTITASIGELSHREQRRRGTYLDLLLSFVFFCFLRYVYIYNNCLVAEAPFLPFRVSSRSLKYANMTVKSSP